MEAPENDFPDGFDFINDIEFEPPDEAQEEPRELPVDPELQVSTG